jgi:hypothetical protein
MDQTKALIRGIPVYHHRWEWNSERTDLTKDPVLILGGKNVPKTALLRATVRFPHRHKPELENGKSGNSTFLP